MNGFEGKTLADRLGPLISFDQPRLKVYNHRQDFVESSFHLIKPGRSGRVRAKEVNGDHWHDDGISEAASVACESLNGHETPAPVPSVQGNLSPFSFQSCNLTMGGDLIDDDAEHWRTACEFAKSRQESQRALFGFKDRLRDPRVECAMRDLWNSAIDCHSQHWFSLRKPFLLSSRKHYTPLPVATCRINTMNGNTMLRKDVRVILEKSICRTEKVNLAQYHSLISFKSNDLAAVYIRVTPRRPIVVLFMTRYEGPVLFFFSEDIALRVILVMMQTKFIEQLHSAVPPERHIDKYALKVLNACELWYVEREVQKKQEFGDPELVNAEYLSYFAPPEDADMEYEDNWSDGDSESDIMTLGIEQEVHSSNGHKRPRRSLPRRPSSSSSEAEDYSNTRFVAGGSSDFTALNGSLEPSNGIAQQAQLEVLTKKQREQRRLEKLLEQRRLLEEEIRKQEVTVQKTVEPLQEIEDRIARVTQAGAILDEGKVAIRQATPALDVLIDHEPRNELATKSDDEAHSELVQDLMNF